MKRALLMLLLVVMVSGYYQPLKAAQEAKDNVMKAKIVNAVQEALKSIGSSDVRRLSQQTAEVQLLGVKVNEKRNQITLNFSREIPLCQ